MFECLSCWAQLFGWSEAVHYSDVGFLSLCLEQRVTESVTHTSILLWSARETSEPTPTLTCPNTDADTDTDTDSMLVLQ